MWLNNTLASGGKADSGSGPPAQPANESLTEITIGNWLGLEGTTKSFHFALFYGDVAHQGERLICIQKVAGSSPVISTKIILASFSFAR